MRKTYSFRIKNPAELNLKTPIIILAIFCLMIISGVASGQTGYNFTPSDGTFEEITGTTMPLSGGDEDQGFFNGIPIGFTFNYWGSDYTTVSASTKGWLTFDQDIFDSQYENNLTSGGTRPLIAPFWDDIALNVYTDFSYTTTGEAGSQIFTLQWLNMKWDYLANGPVISFQVKLYESTGAIEFVYRQESEIPNMGSASIGLAATATGSSNFISLQNTNPDATASTTLETTNLDTRPATGQVYSFTQVSGSQIELTSANPAVAPGDLLQNSVNNVIYRFDCIVTQSETNMTGLSITTAGSYIASDLRYLKAYFSTDPIFSVSTDRQLGRKSGAIGPGTYSFTFSNQLIPVNTTGYLFVVVDLNCTSVSGRTISVDPVEPDDLTFTTGTVTGTAYAGGVQTFQAVTPQNVTSPAAAAGGTSALLTWGIPTGCYDEVMIVGKEGSSITGSPTGDGSTYTASLVFGSGTTFDGGFVLYKGTSSSQTVTSLTAGNTYYFKFFTRKESLWSAGAEVSVTLTPLSSGDYRSAQTGPWSTLTTWQRFNGSTWATPTAGEGTPTAASGLITVQNGHNVTVTGDVSADQLTVNAGGTLTINSNMTLTIASGGPAGCAVSGTLNNSGTVTAAVGTLVFNATGVYRHSRNGGAIPTATWNAGSTCRITGVTANAPSGRGQAFYNFIWDCTHNQVIALSGTPSTVAGTFTLANSGTGGISQGGNVSYANYVQTGGNYYILNNANPRTLTVINFSMQGGTFNMSDFNGTTGTLNVSGNFSYTGGTITETRNDRGHIVFNGTGSPQMYTSTRALVERIDVTVNASAYLQMATDATIIDGRGTFTLSANATLGITSINGIAPNGISSGNIQTQSRVYNTGSHYLYNRAGSQFTGSGLPAAAITGSVTIAAGTTVETTNSIVCNGSLVVTGTLLPGAESQTFSGTGTLSGTGRIKVTRTSDSPEFLQQYTIANTNLTNMLVEYFVAAGGQIISPVTYGNLTLSNTSGENILDGTVFVNGTLTTSTGLLNIDPTGFLTATNLVNYGSITIASSGKASVSNFTNNGIINLSSTSPADYSSFMIDSYTGTGVANAQLYLTGGGGDESPKWHYVAVPTDFNNTTVFTDINVYNLMRYDDSFVPDQSSAAAMDEGFVWWDNYDGKGGFSTLETGRGYAFYNSEDVTAYFADMPSLETSLGTLPLQWSGANRQYPGHYGYNILGNSLTCGLDWELVTETGDVDNTVYYLVNYDIAEYLRGVGGINGGTKDIPPMQGFMVKANAAGAALNFTNARQHTSQQVFYKGSRSMNESKGLEINPMVKLELNNQGREDETMVWFSDKATNGVEGDCDAVKLSFETGSDIYSMSGITKLGINGLPLFETEASIPLTVALKKQSGEYRIIPTLIQGLDDYKVLLIDKYNGNSTTDLRNNPEYQFVSNSGTFSDRFVLKITNLTTSIENDIITSDKPFNVYASGNTLNIKLVDQNWEARNASVSVYDLTGNKIFVENKVQWNLGDLKQFNPNLKKGIYIVEIRTEKERFISKVHLF